METSSNLDNGNTTDAPMPLRAIPYVFWSFLSIETMLIILGNAMLCWLFCHNRKLRTQQNYFVLSLSVSDLLVGLTVAPCEYCAYKQDRACPLFCGTVVSFNMLASTINLVLIASDRYYAIRKPFRYHEVLSKRRVIVIIIFGWLVTFVMTLLPFTWILNTSISVMEQNKIGLIFASTLFSLVLLIGMLLGLSYYRIVRIIQDKLRGSKEKSSNPAGIKVCIMVAISFFICWIPISVVETLSQYGVVISNTIYNISYFILLMNPCLDPIMYAYYRKDFRHELAAWCRRQWEPAKSIHNRLSVRSHNSRKESVYKNMKTFNNNGEVKKMMTVTEGVSVTDIVTVL